VALELSDIDHFLAAAAALKLTGIRRCLYATPRFE